ncbi:flagellar export chaperone FliS [Magnetospirillum molischianum]|uniref:Flagellar secretion chaperone FliS n=1 Tax=Magnetospirillum molischianum DSM 120 TaxID=1150626 RepID=H8FWC0_MAGML|nr:flagellar export chaperone FliS [Magnetospirillum molischianum]CCG42658.1 conserved hypothetical protein [Magnetospirillum molischianum DSM 120]
MIHSQQASAAYRAATMTVPPLHAVVMLYDGVLVRVRNAAAAAERGDWDRQSDEISRAVDLLRGLLAALDFERGGDVAMRLRQTYQANIRALLRSTREAQAVAMCAKIEDGLRQLRNAWAEIAGMPESQPNRMVDPA